MLFIAMKRLQRQKLKSSKRNHSAWIGRSFLVGAKKVVGWLGIMLLVWALVSIGMAFRQRQWLGVETYRVGMVRVDNGEVADVTLAMYLPRSNGLVFMRVPADLLVTVAGGYGEYPLSQLSRLAQIEKIPLDILLTDTLELNFAYEIRTVVTSDDMDTHSLAKALFRESILSMLSLDVTDKSYDQFRVWWMLRSIAMAKEYRFELDQERVYEVFVDVDGLEKRRLSRLMLDDFINRAVPSLVEEFFSTQVVVVNTTGVSGLASQMGRLLTHEGYDVVRVIDEDMELKGKEIWVDDEVILEKMSGQRLLQVVEPDVTKVTDVSDYRADAVVFIGDE